MDGALQQAVQNELVRQTLASLTDPAAARGGSPANGAAAETVEAAAAAGVTAETEELTMEIALRACALAMTLRAAAEGEPDGEEVAMTPTGVRAFARGLVAGLLDGAAERDESAGRPDGGAGVTSVTSVTAVTDAAGAPAAVAGGDGGGMEALRVELRTLTLGVLYQVCTAAPPCEIDTVCTPVRYAVYPWIATVFQG